MERGEAGKMRRIKVMGRYEEKELGWWEELWIVMENEENNGRQQNFLRGTFLEL